MSRHHLLRTVLFILFTGYYFSAGSQSLYEIKFSDKNNNQYKCMLVYFHENSSYIRTAYFSNNKYNVVEINYNMVYGTTSTGLKYCMLKKTSNPEFITDKSPTQSYNPDYFIWFFNSVSGKYDDLYTTDDSTFHAENYRRVISYIQLQSNAITDTYLREFFGSDEYKYTALKKMCGLTTVQLKPLNQLVPTKLHLIIVANTLDPKIGLSCKTDRINLRNEFKQMADALGISFQDYVVEEDNFNKTNVLSTLNSVFPGKNDIVLFIYRGHGFRWQNQLEKWPRLSLKISQYEQPSMNNSINLKEIKDILDGKGARLNIVLGDCCNSEISSSAITGNNYWSYQVDNNSDISKLRTLFINTRGSIISAAARPGEVSYASPQGGLYSISFLQALQQEISYFETSPCKWDDILSKTIQLALDKSLPQNCGNCSTQNGINEVSVSVSY